MTPRTWPQHNYWNKFGLKPWQPLRLVCEDGEVMAPEKSAMLKRLAIDVTAVLSRHVKNLPEN
jgi:hypothetical protein